MLKQMGGGSVTRGVAAARDAEGGAAKELAALLGVRRAAGLPIDLDPAPLIWAPPRAARGRTAERGSGPRNPPPRRDPVRR